MPEPRHMQWLNRLRGYRTSTVLVAMMLGAFLIPCVVFTTLILTNANRSAISQREGVFQNHAESAVHLLSQELSFYQLLSRTLCTGPEQSLLLAASPVLVCGVLRRGEITIHYQASRGSAYLSLESLRESTWWPILQRAAGSFILFNQTTGIAPPYYRKFIVTVSTLAAGDHAFAVVDSSRIHDTLTELSARLESSFRSLLVVTTPAGELIYAPEEVRYAVNLATERSIFNQGDYTRLGDKEYRIWRKEFPSGAFPAQVLTLTDSGFTDPGQAKLLVLLIFCASLMIALAAVASASIHRTIASPLSQLSNLVLRASRDLQSLDRILSELRAGKISEIPLFEIQNLAHGLEALLGAIENRDSQLSQLTGDLVEAKSMARLGELGAQVAHDIRSPLAALSMVVDTLPQLSEDKRVLLRTAMDRIRDIANNLVRRNREYVDRGAKPLEPQAEGVRQGPLAPTLIALLVEEIVSEQRLRCQGQQGITIETAWAREAYSIFVSVLPSEFKRVLSNLLDNAWEALQGQQGTIQIGIERVPKGVSVQVIDNGPGIPKEILPLLGQRGATYGKAEGSGLGLYFARTCCEKWGGNLSIECPQTGGARVDLHLPIAEPPSWHVKELNLSQSEHVVILDDDPSIHQIWDSRLRSMPHSSKIKITHCYHSQELRDWCRNAGGNLPNTVFLIDHELLGESVNGVDVIRGLPHGVSAFLVTSRYDDDSVMRSVELYQLKLLPKAMAAFVPLRGRQA